MAGLRHILSVAIIGALSTACYQGVDGPGEAIYQRSVDLNSIYLNTMYLNAPYFNAPFFNTPFFNAPFFNAPFFNTTYFNGGYFNGPFFNGTRIESVTLNGAAVDAITLDGSDLVATQGGVEHTGEEVVGLVITMTLQAEDSEGNAGEMLVDIRVDSAYPDPSAATGDVMLYDLSMGLSGSGEWANPCVNSEGEGKPIIFLRNYWDETTGDRIDDSDVFTLACTTGVLAHCTQWGYRPWGEGSECTGQKGKKGKKCETVDLHDYHQACTRMARADYCGDGTPWTIAGTPIDIWDGLSPQINARSENWKIEAEWTPDGAYCLSDIRQQQWKADGKYPSCGKDFDKQNKKIHDCGSLEHNRALLASSFEPPKKSPKKKKKKKWNW